MNGGAGKAKLASITDVLEVEVDVNRKIFSTNLT